MPTPVHSKTLHRPADWPCKLLDSHLAAKADCNDARAVLSLQEVMQPGHQAIDPGQLLVGREVTACNEDAPVLLCSLQRRQLSIPALCRTDAR